MFASAFNDPAFQRRKAEQKQTGFSTVRLTPMSFKAGHTHEIRLVNDSKLLQGWHFNTVHKLERGEEEPDEKVLCTESQIARKGCPCPCCQWYEQFATDQVEEDEDGNQTIIQKSLRTRLLSAAEKNERIAPDIKEIVSGADKLGIFDSRTVVFVGVARNAVIFETPNESGGEPWKNIGPGEGIVSFTLNCSGKDHKFFMQIEELLVAMKREGCDYSDLVSPEHGAWLNYKVTENYQKTVTLGKREPLRPEILRLISGNNFPPVAKWNQAEGKGTKGANLVVTYDTTCSKIARCPWYKKLHAKYMGKLTAAEIQALDVTQYQESVEEVELED